MLLLLLTRKTDAGFLFFRFRGGGTFFRNLTLCWYTLDSSLCPVPFPSLQSTNIQKQRHVLICFKQTLWERHNYQSQHEPRCRTPASSDTPDNRWQSTKMETKPNPCLKYYCKWSLYLENHKCTLYKTHNLFIYLI